MQDMGCTLSICRLGLQSFSHPAGYTINALRYLTNSNPIEVTSATPELVPNKDGSPSLVDGGMSAELVFPNNITGSLTANLRAAPLYGFVHRVLPWMYLKVQCEGGDVVLFNYVMATLYHYIEVSVKTGKEGKERKKRVEKVYKPTADGAKGEDWWSTYVELYASIIHTLTCPVQLSLSIGSLCRQSEGPRASDLAFRRRLCRKYAVGRKSL